MKKGLVQWQRRKRAVELLDVVNKKSDRCYLIHYSCESFYNIKDGHTPRITSIAVRNYDSGQTYSFSIHKSAEQFKIPMDDIDKKYNELEKSMLDQYFEFVKNKECIKYIHWNMRDINFGFQAIEHRYRVLGGEPCLIDSEKKLDLARELIALHGIKYIGHKPHGRLHNLLEFNHITMKDILTGQEEAECFDNKDFVRLHQSTLRKVDAIANILERTLNNSLKTKASFWDRYGVYPEALSDVIIQHWLWSLVTIIIAIVTIISWLKWL